MTPEEKQSVRQDSFPKDVKDVSPDASGRRNRPEDLRVHERPVVSPIAKAGLFVISF